MGRKKPASTCEVDKSAVCSQVFASSPKQTHLHVRHFASASTFALAAVFLASPSQWARAADECLANQPGADTVVCSGASYSPGVIYNDGAT
jgi:hypothetical protein